MIFWSEFFAFFRLPIISKVYMLRLAIFATYHIINNLEGSFVEQWLTLFNSPTHDFLCEMMD